MATEIDGVCEVEEFDTGRMTDGDVELVLSGLERARRADGLDDEALLRIARSDYSDMGGK